MADTILGLLHNMKDYEHYDGQPFKLQKEEKDMLIAFLEQKDVQKCIPKVPRKFTGSTTGQDKPFVYYECPTCHEIVAYLDCSCACCGQRIKWGKENEKKNSIGSSIFDNFNVNINDKQ